ncbi:MAG: primase-helicase family protein [Rectinemataceae bacterium]|jgi:hypothetical protein
MDKIIEVLVELVGEEAPGLVVSQFYDKLLGKLIEHDLLGLLAPVGARAADGFTGIPESALEEYFSYYQKRCTAKRSAGLNRIMTPEWAMKHFNGRFAKIVFGGKCLVMDRDLSRGLRTYDRDTFYSMFTDVMIRNSSPGGNPYLAACVYWFRHTRLYESVVFDPNPDYIQKADEINLWQGYPYQPEANGRAEQFLRFTHDIICSADDRSYDFLFALLAKIIQQPHVKYGEGIAVALRGKQGVGKNVFVESVGKLFGQAFTTVTDTAQLTRNFNSQLFNKIIVFGDEAIWGGEKRSRSILKSIITSPVITIEKKYSEPFEAPNYIRLFTATNEDWAAPKELGDRRWFVLDVSDERRRDDKYFESIRLSLENGGYNDLMYRLMSTDISSVNFQNDMPSTEAGLINSISSLEPRSEYFLYVLLRDDIQHVRDGEKPEVFNQEITCDGLFQKYSQYAKDQQIKYPMRREELGKVVSRLFGGSVRRFQKRWGGRMKYYYDFPDLDTAKEEFDENLGITVNWDTLLGGGMRGVEVVGSKDEWNRAWELQPIIRQVETQSNTEEPPQDE